MAGVGFYGKIPAQGDFVRVNAADPVCLAFDQWMAECIDTSQRSSVPLPPEPTNFFFRAPGAKNALVGMFAPSQDSVGRQYPMVIFALIELKDIATRYPAVPILYGNFLGSAYTIIQQGKSITSARLSELVRALSSPMPGDFAIADQVCRRTLDSTPASELSRRLFDGGAPGKSYYAFRTFLNACEPARSKEPAKTNVTLDCPIACDTDLFTWLEIARRLLRWNSGPPAFFWTEGNTPRVLIPVGPPPPQTLVYLSRPDHGGQRLWPVLTERPDAIDAARNQLGAQHRRAIEEPQTTLEGLVAALSG